MQGPADLKSPTLARLFDVGVDRDRDRTFLVNGDGRVIATFWPQAEDYAQTVADALNAALKAKAAA